MKGLLKNALSVGYHDNGPFFKLLLYQNLIRRQGSMSVPSLMLVAKSAQLWQKPALISWTRWDTNRERVKFTYMSLSVVLTTFFVTCR